MRLAVLPLLALLVAAPLPAYAGSWSAGDPRRDVRTWSFEADPEPCGTYTERRDPGDESTDVVRLAVRHTATTVRVAVGFRDLDATSEHSTEIFLRTSAGDYEATVTRNGPWRKPFTDLMEMPDYAALAEEADECGSFSFGTALEHCPGLRGELDPTLDRAVVSIPRACLGEPRWVRAGASASTWLGDTTTIAGSSDRWQPPGTPDSARVDGPYGPRVRVG